ncbi:hypothetical protein BH23GEM6_BH23GEM6_12900 [soil metagenome]
MAHKNLFCVMSITEEAFMFLRRARVRYSGSAAFWLGTAPRAASFNP